MMKTLLGDWHESLLEKPMEGEAVWIQTFQNHINLSWYLNGRYWPYGGDITDGRKPFGDKHGDCDVMYWQFADLPVPVGHITE